MTITNHTEKVDSVSVVIDGVEMEVPKGTLVIRAAEQIGIEIPRFCDHPLLVPVANCRACLIEIDGGVTNENAAKLISCGANVLVAGSHVFKAKHPEEKIKREGVRKQ